MFQTDGKLYKFFALTGSLIGLNLLWILFSLPIVTIPGATYAAFKGLDRRSIDTSETTVIRFGRNFIKTPKVVWALGTVLSLLILGTAVALIAFRVSGLFQGLGLTLLVMAIVVGIHFYPSATRSESTRRTLSLTALKLLSSPLITFLLSFAFIAWFYLLELLALSGAVIVVFFAAILPFQISRLFSHRLHRKIKERSGLDADDLSGENS